MNLLIPENATLIVFPVFPDNELSEKVRNLEQININRAKQEIRGLGLYPIGDELSNEYYNYIRSKSRTLKIKDLFYLNKWTEQLIRVEYVYFCKGWENSQISQIVHDLAKRYEIPTLYEKDPKDAQNNFFRANVNYDNCQCACKLC